MACCCTASAGFSIGLAGSLDPFRWLAQERSSNLQNRADPRGHSCRNRWDRTPLQPDTWTRQEEGAVAVVHCPLVAGPCNHYPQSCHSRLVNSICTACPRLQDQPCHNPGGCSRLR